MRQSQLFTKTRRDAPKDETAKNAELLIRGGFIHKELSGVYSYLPLGLRVVNNIIKIIREEMDAIGGQEVSLTALQDPEIWEQTNRWDDSVIDIWFKTTLKSGSELGLASTHEEPMTHILAEFVSSYKDLPKYVYQFQTKFRNELRAKSGIMRTREFVMKDLYSFSRSEEAFKDFYEKCAVAYGNIFKRAGIGKSTYRTFASGGAFSKYSEEFQTVSDVGEDTIYISKEKGIAVNKEVYTDEVLSDLGLKKGDLEERRAIEVGNIFPLGSLFSEPLGLTFKDESGEEKPVVMGSYGIGPGRLMGVVVETLSDEKGIVWPKEIAPFALHLVSVGNDDERVVAATDGLYKRLIAKGVAVLYDDRTLRPGEKFADADLIGIPTRVVVSQKTLDAGKVEVIDRKTGKEKMVDEGELL
jgi:prolyl-tRNA synthetase